jgi:hypothetical protein
MAGGDLTWRGASWSDGPRPPEGYLLLSSSVNGIWAVVAGLALIGLLLDLLAARYATSLLPRLARAVGFGLTGGLAVSAAAGVALFGWSVQLWDAALTWPPMIIGAVLVGAAWFALARAARYWLLSARGPRVAG